MTPKLVDVILRWTRIGAAFGAESTGETPDLERLIIDAAEVLPENSRLLVLAATWLSAYPYFVARHRLNSLIADLSEDHRAQLGLLLDAAAALKKTDHFNDAIGLCRSAAKPSDPKPLFLAQRANPVWHRLAEKEAWKLSRRWGLWCQPFEAKKDAIRPARWIIEHNPSYVERVVLRGDLRLSILLQLRGNTSAGESEYRLAKQCGVQRNAVRHSLELLEGASLVERSQDGRRSAIHLTSSAIALQPV